MEDHGPGRVRDPSMGRLVQPPAATRQLRPADARRIRADESETDHSIKTASTIPGAVHRALLAASRSAELQGCSNPAGGAAGSGARSVVGAVRPSQTL